MERCSYWQRYAAQAVKSAGGSGSASVGSSGGCRSGNEEILIIWGGRQLSPEAYLAVPTFLRRGLRPGN